ncbi:MAG TPA: MFS transporter [Candidatus Aquilonibacter sp.]|nr:MFS transporter [Candidatus Aquilonibacter sp.]
MEASARIGAALNSQNASAKPSVIEVIDQHSLGAFQIWTVALCGFVLVLDGFDGQIISYTAPSIAQTMHVAVSRFGTIFSSSLIGLMIAAMVSGPIADRWGRKWPVIVSVFSFAVFSLATAHVTSLGWLWVLRFATGLGLGGAMPNVVALASEYVPRRLLAVAVPIVFVGMPLGGTLAGLASAAIIPKWGWRSMFYIGGAFPLVMSIALIALLPESIRFLAVKGKAPEKIRRIAARIAPELAPEDLSSAAPPGEEKHAGVSVKHLFTEGRALGTVLLWIPFFTNLLLMYFTASWLPALLRAEGMSTSAASTASAFVSFGGMFACVIEGYFIKWRGAAAVLLAQYVLAGAFLALLARMPASFQITLVLTFTVGFMIIGAQGGLNALAANFYPTAVRSTGVGWALGVGRIGSIVGPLLGGMFLTMGWKPSGMLLFASAVAVCACVAILLGAFTRGASAYRTDPAQIH